MFFYTRRRPSSQLVGPEEGCSTRPRKKNGGTCARRAKTVSPAGRTRDQLQEPPAAQDSNTTSLILGDGPPFACAATANCSTAFEPTANKAGRGCTLHRGCKDIVGMVPLNGTPTGAPPHHGWVVAGERKSLAVHCHSGEEDAHSWLYSAFFSSVSIASLAV